MGCGRSNCAELSGGVCRATGRSGGGRSKKVKSGGGSVGSSSMPTATIEQTSKEAEVVTTEESVQIDNRIELAKDESTPTEVSPQVKHDLNDGTPEAQQAKKIILIGQSIWGKYECKCNFIEYSGRGTYGYNCIAYTMGDAEDGDEAFEKFEKAGFKPVMDSLGNGVVIIFPSIKPDYFRDIIKQCEDDSI